MNIRKRRKYKKMILGSLIAVFAIAVVCFLTIHTKRTDRFNPFIPYQEDFAVVKRGTDTYNNVQFINAEGKDTDTLSLKGNDPYRQYIAVYHKGKYIKKMTYVTLNEVPYDAREKLMNSSL